MASEIHARPKQTALPDWRWDPSECIALVMFNPEMTTSVASQGDDIAWACITGIDVHLGSIIPVKL